MMAKHARAGELELVMDCNNMLATEIHAVWPQAHYLPSKTRAAIDALVAEIPGKVGQLEQADQVGLGQQIF